jgi:hypothetical protein
LKLKCDNLVSNYASKFNLRRSNKAMAGAFERWYGMATEAGAYTRSLFSST